MSWMIGKIGASTDVLQCPDSWTFDLAGRLFISDRMMANTWHPRLPHHYPASLMTLGDTRLRENLIVDKHLMFVASQLSTGPGVSLVFSRWLLIFHICQLQHQAPPTAARSEPGPECQAMLMSQCGSVTQISCEVIIEHLSVWFQLDVN